MVKEAGVIYCMGDKTFAAGTENDNDFE